MGEYRGILSCGNNTGFCETLIGRGRCVQSIVYTCTYKVHLHTTQMYVLKNIFKPGIVMHAWHSSTLGNQGRRIASKAEPSLGTLARLRHKQTNKQTFKQTDQPKHKEAGEAVWSKDPRFSPQYCKKESTPTCTCTHFKNYSFTPVHDSLTSCWLCILALLFPQPKASIQRQPHCLSGHRQAQVFSDFEYAYFFFQYWG